MSKFFTPQEKKQFLRLPILSYIITGLIILFAGTASAQSDSLVSTNHPANYIEAATLGQLTGGYSSGFVQLQWNTSSEVEKVVAGGPAVAAALRFKSTENEVVGTGGFSAPIGRVISPGGPLV